MSSQPSPVTSARYALRMLSLGVWTLLSPLPDQIVTTGSGVKVRKTNWKDVKPQEPQLQLPSVAHNELVCGVFTKVNAEEPLVAPMCPEKQSPCTVCGKMIASDKPTRSDTVRRREH